MEMISYSQLQNTVGVQVIPINEKKVPIVKQWEQSTLRHDLSQCYGVGIVCGSISGNLEAIDIDLKYDLTGKLFSEYQKTVIKVCPGLLQRLVVQKTTSGGYHLIYRCEIIDGNKKLAQRYANEAEQKVGEKIKVLFETRGNGGYIACFPTPGYELINGTFDNIPTITVQERETLLNIAYSFNEVQKEFKPPIVEQKKQTKGLKPTEDFNERGDVVALLEEYGWTAVGRKGSKILMRRPGDTKADSSGNYDEELKWFSVFSTSTEFEAQTPYQPYAVYGVLKCDGDWNKVPKMLYDEGYGDRIENQRDNDIVIPSRIDMSDDDTSFLATEDDYDGYLDAWRNGSFELGKSTGIPTLDKHFLFKEGNLVIINGLDNVGKSSVIWYLEMLSAIFHDWKWLIFSSENRVGGVIRKLIEFYWCEPINTMSQEKYIKAKQFVKDHFDIIKCGDKLFNYNEILNMTTKAMRKKKYNGLMIDPYNSLKIDIPIKSKQSGYDYHYEAASVIQLYCKNNNLSIYLNCHVGTVGARNKGKDGFTMAPQKEDTEMGVMFANKADEFLTIHRVTQNEKAWMFTEIHVRKVKETETGGNVTWINKPVDLRMINHLTGFETSENRDLMEPGFNPIVEYHRVKSKPVQGKIDITETVRERALQPNYNYDYAPMQSDDNPPF
jgi:hypothetical protein